ncbi:MAG: MG2 domain-containing protein [Rhizobiaceae bacterium]
MPRIALALALILTALTVVVAQERRLTVTPQADYFGGDYDILKEVELDACKARCLADQRCKAFTYQENAQWCFLKESAGERRPIVGATAGLIETGDAIVPVDENIIAQRDELVDFLPKRTRERARRVRLAIAVAKERPEFAGMDNATVFEIAKSAPNTDRSRNALLEALRRDTGNAALWKQLTLAALANEPREYKARRESDALERQAVVNTIILAIDEPARADAFRLLGQVYEKQRQYKTAIKAYRKAQSIEPNETFGRKLDELLAKYGFRITSNNIDADTARPRICLVFSESLGGGVTAPGRAGDFVKVEGGTDLPVTAKGNQLCVDGLLHGGRYRVIVRSGVTSEDGETLRRDITTSVYVRDRKPAVRFSSNAYVLPAGGEATVPVTTINTGEIEAKVQRLDERALASLMKESRFLKQFRSYDVERISESDGVDIWSGTVPVEQRTNREVVTAIPVSQIAGELKPGIHVLTARTTNGRPDESERATQWFVVSDIGLTTFAAEDGFHIIARSLGSAQPLPNVTLDLVAINDRKLTSIQTDENGYARLPAGIVRGSGGNRPAVLTARLKSDFVFLDLTATPFDLTDRGVEGRAPAGALDVFLTPERGVYRAGATVHMTGTMRDARSRAVEDLTLTGIVKRPDGVEQARLQLSDQGTGGFVWDHALSQNAMRGRWTFAIHSDPRRAALAETKVLVADFEPERVDFTVEAQAETLNPANPAPITIDARYLFGAAGSGLTVNGEAIIKADRTLKSLPGYVFGLASEKSPSLRQPFEASTTDKDGKATLTLGPFQPPGTTLPLAAKLQMRVADTNGRPVERHIDLPLAGSTARLGIKPQFDGAVEDHQDAVVSVIAIDSDGKRIALDKAEWQLERIRTDYQWYKVDGRWNYEPVRSRSRVAQGEAAIATTDPLTLTMPVEWGRYELTVTDLAGTALPVSLTFNAGWYVEAKAAETPNVANVSLDKERYKVGDTARVFVEPRFAGEADILVMDERVVSRIRASIAADGTTVEVPVTREWGPGAYVTAVIYRPMDIEKRIMPARAIGVAHAKTDPGAAALHVTIATSLNIKPRAPFEAVVDVAGLQPGEEAFATLAMVDEGVLNVTQFEPPSLSGHYFGQRQLGVAIRDLYSKLIDRMQGALGSVRSGGDGGPADLGQPPQLDEVVAQFSGLVKVGDDGKARITFDVPDFNGSLRLDALAWSKTGIGEASTKVISRDPVVLAASRPLFLAPGDTSRISIDATNVDGPEGTMQLAIAGPVDGKVTLEGQTIFEVNLPVGERKSVEVPVRAVGLGKAVFDVALTLPGGDVLTKSFSIDVRSNAPKEVNTSSLDIASGGSLTLDKDLLAGFVPGSASATLSVTGAAKFDVGGVLRALDDYRYRCTEQQTSRAFPLVSLPQDVIAAALEIDESKIRERVQKAVAGVLANQDYSGSFGLWSPGSTGIWLDAYVADFLTRAQEQGFEVPQKAFDLTLNNLRNGLEYLPGQGDLGPAAYAAYVLARNGRAAIGDLRYMAETQGKRFATPLAKAHLAGALALYGERERASTLMANAMQQAATSLAHTPTDFGSALRDDAAVVSVALNSGLRGTAWREVLRNVATSRRATSYTSTQEDAWSLLAAAAVLKNEPPKLTVGGAKRDGALVTTLDAQKLSAGFSIGNRADAPVSAEVTIRGVPLVAPPAKANGYRIDRRHYALDGKPIDIARVARGTRVVAVVEIVPLDEGFARIIVDDPLPAGFAIDNPQLLKGGDVKALDFLALTGEATHQEFRNERFIASFEKQKGDTDIRRFGYIVRAVTPGTFTHPAAIVENMYQPERRGRTAEGWVSVLDQL